MSNHNVAVLSLHIERAKSFVSPYHLCHYKFSEYSSFRLRWFGDVFSGLDILSLYIGAVSGSNSVKFSFIYCLFHISKFISSDVL